MEISCGRSCPSISLWTELVEIFTRCRRDFSKATIFVVYRLGLEDLGSEIRPSPRGGGGFLRRLRYFRRSLDAFGLRAQRPSLVHVYVQMCAMRFSVFGNYSLRPDAGTTCMARVCFRCMHAPALIDC